MQIILIIFINQLVEMERKHDFSEGVLQSLANLFDFEGHGGIVVKCIQYCISEIRYRFNLTFVIFSLS